MSAMPNCASLYRTARVAAVPLRYGAGVKLKVVEALREGLPLVTTSIGAQGMPGLEQWHRLRRTAVVSPMRSARC